MAREVSGFFDSVSRDRVYQADRFAKRFRLVMSDGILNGGNNLRVTAPGTGMQVEVDFGAGMVRGYDYFLEDDATGKLVLQLAEADAQKRIDRIVLRMDTGTGKREVYADVVKGTPGASPAPPALVREGNIYELSLAKVTVDSSTMVIMQGDITDERYNAEVCGLINSLIALDASDFQAQAQEIIDGLAGMGYLPATGGTLGAYTEKRVVLSDGGVDLDEGNVFVHTPSGDITYSISNAVSGQAHSFTLIINMGATVQTLTFPESVKWQGGKIPDMTTANKTYVLTFLTVDGGTTWLGMSGGEF